MSEFKQYRRKATALLRPVTKEEIDRKINPKISISQVDIDAGSPLAGDMIAQNPSNPNDMWLIAKRYFDDNFEEV